MFSVLSYVMLCFNLYFLDLGNIALNGGKVNEKWTGKDIELVVACFNVSTLHRLEGLNKITKYLSRLLNFMIGIETRISRIRSKSAKLPVPLLYVMLFYKRRKCYPLFCMYVRLKSVGLRREHTLGLFRHRILKKTFVVRGGKWQRKYHNEELRCMESLTNIIRLMKMVKGAINGMYCMHSSVDKCI